MPPRTRKLAGTVNNAVKAVTSASSPSKRGVKRKAAQEQSNSGSDFEEGPTKKARSTRKAPSSPQKANIEAKEEAQTPPPAPKVDWSVERPPFLPAALNFSYGDARAHLISVDPRFEAMFEKLACRPFIKLERVEPFRCVFPINYTYKFSNVKIERWLPRSCVSPRDVRVLKY
jgi:DNA-3-methyladenine glycosylase II